MMLERFKDLMRPILRKVCRNDFARALLPPLGRAGLLPRVLSKRLPVEGNFVVSLPNQHSFIYEGSRTDILARDLFWRPSRGYEFETISAFHSAALSAKSVIDIGANTGLYPLIACAANPLSRVMVFEPVRRTRERLVRNLGINGWIERCDVRSEAVSNFTGSAKFYVPPGDSPLSGTLESGFTGAKGDLIEVPVTTIDEICSDTKGVDLAKIDVEGSEDKVLQGMQKVLQESAPTIFIECNPNGPIHGIQIILRRYDYQFFHLLPEGPVRVGAIVPDRKGRYRNFLCVTNKR
jgi:FkbM family methyltransferase